MQKISNKKKLGIREIAELSGVSMATVSRVINHPQMTTLQTRNKVMKVIQENEYIPTSARKSNYGDMKFIAVFLHDIQNPFNAELFDKLNFRAFENNYTLVFCNAKSDYDLEEKYYEYCKTIHTSAFIYAGDTGKNILERNDIDPSSKIILLDREGLCGEHYYSISPDNKKGSALLVDYLYKLNHKKIGYIAGPNATIYARERLEGFCEAMEKLGLQVPEHYIAYSDCSLSGGAACFDYFYSMSDAPTAIIAVNDLSAHGFIMRANFLGVKIPDEFSVCGFDGADSDSFYPQITSIRQDVNKIADTVFSIILNSGDEPLPHAFCLDVSMCMGITCHKI
ncbi:MAG: LacI family DNA-binding transcriptional regulator [Christensenellales bacterium]